MVVGLSVVALLASFASTPGGRPGVPGAGREPAVLLNVIGRIDHPTVMSTFARRALFDPARCLPERSQRSRW
jgi:hypothetical protein